MLFASFDFLLFFVPVFIGFWSLRKRPVARTLFLIAASYFFYSASAKPPEGKETTAWYYAGLLLFSTILDYVCSARIHAAAGDAASANEGVATKARRRRNTYLVISLVGNLSLLGYFKYTNFLIEAFTDLANVFGASFVAPHLKILMPIGISFYTFQSLSYTIDVWRGRLTPEPSFRKFALFVVFFPQLVAGPIVRASEFLPQLHRRPRLAPGDLEEGLFRIWRGLIKKVVLGDFIAVYFADVVFDAPSDYTSFENLLALYAFTLEIYADFSGYSDIAIGVARLMGFKIPENFDRPYQAKNLGEFWRRWHMTLSTWLRDYLFFPLGGSRGSKARTYFNVWLTMFLVGMWHGASWNFVIYSNVHGAAMVFNRWNRIRNKDQPLAVTAAIAFSFALVTASVLYFLGVELLDLDVLQSAKMGAMCLVLFMVVTLLPDTGTKLNAFFHILLTFHFTVISRIFFRAETFDNAKIMLGKLLSWDGHWFRPGLFETQGISEWISWNCNSFFYEMLRPVSNYGLLILLIAGTAYHFTNRKWIEIHMRNAFHKLPGPVLGIVFGTTMLMIMHLLNGPRANIYFVF